MKLAFSNVNCIPTISDPGILRNKNFATILGGIRETFLSSYYFVDGRKIIFGSVIRENFRLPDPIEWYNFLFSITLKMLFSMDSSVSSAWISRIDCTQLIRASPSEKSSPFPPSQEGMRFVISAFASFLHPPSFISTHFLSLSSLPCQGYSSLHSHIASSPIYHLFSTTGKFWRRMSTAIQGVYAQNYRKASCAS